MIYDCIIVGGGCAGLAAATYLSEQGQKVCILEKTQTLGGRASSHYDDVKKEHIDNGQHLFLGAYKDTQKYLDRIGMQKKLLFFPSLAIPLQEKWNSKVYCFSSGNFPTGLHMLGAIFGLKMLSWKDRRAFFWMGFQALFQKNKLKNKSIENWLNINKVSEQAKDRFWKLFVRSIFNANLEESSALQLAFVLKQAYMGKKFNSSPGLSSLGLSELLGDPAQNFLEKRNCSVFFRQKIEKIEKIKNADFKIYAGAQILKSKTCILALPPKSLQKLNWGKNIKNQMKAMVEKSKKMKPNAIVSIYLWTKKPLSKNLFQGYWGLEFDWIFQRNLFLQNSKICSCFVISDAKAWLKKSSQEIKNEVIKILPSELWDNNEILDIKIRKEPYATYTRALNKNSKVFLQTPVKSLFLAGDWLDEELPCTIESAIRSGHKAAILVVKN